MVQCAQTLNIVILTIKFVKRSVRGMETVVEDTNVLKGNALRNAGGQTSVQKINTATSKITVLTLISHCLISEKFTKNFSIIIRKKRFCRENCVENSHCNNQEICLNGECQPGCTSDDHCKQGESCQDGKCLISCQSNQACQQGYYCHIDNKVCYERCSTDSNCTQGYKCYEGQCLRYCGLLKTQFECPKDQYCHR